MTNVDRRHALKLIGATATLGMTRSASADQPDDDFGPRQKFVLIHGAWHGGFAWDGVASRLRDARPRRGGAYAAGYDPGRESGRD